MAEWSDARSLVTRLPLEIFSHPVARNIFNALRALSETALTLDFSELESHVVADAGPLVARLLLEESAHPEEREKGEKGLARLHIPLLQLKIRHLEESAASLQPEIQKAEITGEKDAHARLSREKHGLAVEVARLKAELKSELRRPR
jgi:FtsZ-binding cell division protein ZapB